MARHKKVELPKTELNITSMMDLVLNLLTFFVLVSNFAVAELPALDPPDPVHSKALSVESPNKLTLNIIPSPDKSGLASAVKFGSSEMLSPGDTEGLSLALAKEYAKSKDVQIDLRADKTLRYDQVSPIMGVIKNAGITHINVVAQVNQDKE